MAQKHPDNAAYVSADGKVSFDRYGRKLDSLGNLAGSRQRAGDAGASPIERREEKKEEKTLHLSDLKPAASPRALAIAARGQQRRAWDNAPVSTPEPTAGGPVARRGNNPNVLAPGGIDPETGKPYPTARNGGLSVDVQQPRSAWRQPWMRPQAPLSVVPQTQSRPVGRIPFEVEGLNTSQPGDMGAAFRDFVSGWIPPLQAPAVGDYYPGQSVGRGRWDDTVNPAPPPVIQPSTQPPRYPGMADPRGRWR